MQTDLDFSKIRTHNGSQNAGFEELICQLARLSPPENADSFIRKEGLGGDAGVECFWRLKDGSEHGWQAKYFLNTIKDPQWRQIDNSVKKALQKHPQLKKYYICVPLDRTDQKQNNKQSMLDKWDKKIKEWEQSAKSKNMDVKFEWWGKSEILDILSSNNPQFSGRLLYWFNQPILQIQDLEGIAQQSKSSLGERFSPETNVELPIAKSFEGIGVTPKWHNRLVLVAKEWFESLEQLENIILDKDNCIVAEKFQNQKDIIYRKWGNVKNKTSELKSLLTQTVEERSLHNNLDKLKKIISSFSTEYKSNDEIPDNLRRMQWYYNRFMDKTHSLSKFLFSSDMTAFSIKSMLISGEAGVGKSHLLCDVTLNRLENNLPTLFLLGQHYAGGDPLHFIAQSLNLVNHSHKKILEALDALGEAYSSRTLIIIDAINEGHYKEEWKNHIVNLITELHKYPYISFVFSCRSSYLQYLLPQINNSGETQNNAKLTVKIEHKGFSDLNDIYKYLEKQDIFVPKTPIMEPEFSNPLFLKIYCKALKMKGEEQFSQGSKSIETIFNFYVDSISKTINRNKQYRPEETIVSKALYSFALQLFPNNLYGLQTSKAREIIKVEDPTPNTGCLLNELLNEGILFEDIIPVKKENSENGCEYEKEPVVRFTYERFSDYFIVKSLIEKEIYKKPKKLKKIINKIKYFLYKIISKKYCLDNENLKLYFKKNSALGNIFLNNKSWGFNGIIEALFTKIADDFKVELYDLIEIENNQYLLKESLEKSFLWRSPDSFTLRTFELLSQLRSIYFHSPILQILLKLSVKPDHPWNADLLHKILIDKILAKRDRLWSTYICYSYHYNEDSTIHNLTNWPYSANLQNLESERARLYAMVLIWFTTSSHRELRDKATKSAIIILSRYPKHLLKLINQFSEVNDLYVAERLYAIVYGVVVNIEDKKLIKNIAEQTYEKMFKTGKPVPHILLRNYARCVLEFAYNKKLLPDGMDPQKFRPPYNSDWPIENPMNSELDSLDNSFGSIKYSLMGHSGDFGIYTMGCIHRFSPTSLRKNKPETGLELQQNFTNSLDQKKHKLCLAYINQVSKNHSLFGYMETPKQEELKNEIRKTLNEKQQEQFRWLFEDRYMGKQPASFSRKWAQRWICKKVYEMGWKKELFETFERDMCIQYRSGKKVERIGKKYQWIAFHKLLAHLADNVHYIGYYDNKNKYEGPWQLYCGDIDPTIYFKSSSLDHNSEGEEIINKIDGMQIPANGTERPEQWLESQNNIPEFKTWLQINNWTILKSFIIKKHSPLFYNLQDSHQSEIWFRINAIIVPKDSRNNIINDLKQKDLRSVDIGRGTIRQFFREYPNRFNENKNEDWKTELNTNTGPINFLYQILVTEYSSEFDEENKSTYFYMPSPVLLNNLDLHCPPGQFKYWINNKKEKIFKNENLQTEKHPIALIKTSSLNKWLKQKKLSLIWIIGGEKRIYEKDEQGFIHEFSGIYFNDDTIVKGHIWFLKQYKYD